ncbi:MAG: hypothetical protein SFV19_12195 [Rhodospirillaceae bacterium]|nr:hypothetical protein [Rhodospirillaceae bacterium]
MKSIVWTHTATKVTRKVQPKRRAMMIGAVEALARGEPSDVKRLEGQPGRYRLRCGDWRLLLDMDAVSIVVRDVVPCGEAYAKKNR